MAFVTNMRYAIDVATLSFLLVFFCKCQLKSKPILTNTLIALRLAEFQEIYQNKFSREKHISCDNFSVLVCKNCP